MLCCLCFVLFVWYSSRLVCCFVLSFVLFVNFVSALFVLCVLCLF